MLGVNIHFCSTYDTCLQSCINLFRLLLFP
uniref:Uncharacterized protein n=1 Tax=Arundo donax TaxID=35708 RepID=A0A0A9A5H2_ARUDO